MYKKIMCSLVLIIGLILANPALAIEEFVTGDIQMEKALSQITEKSAAKLLTMVKQGKNKFSKIKNVAVYPVENDIDNIVTDKLISILVSNSGFNVIEREQLADIIKTQKIERSGLFKKTTIIKVGELSGVHAVISGIIKSKKNILGVINIRMNLKMHDIQTGQLIWSTEETLETREGIGKYREVIMIIIAVMIIMIIWWFLTRVPKGVTGVVKKAAEGFDYSGTKSRLHSDNMIRGKISRELKKADAVLNDIIIALEKKDSTKEAVTYNDFKKELDLMKRKIENAEYGGTRFFKQEKVKESAVNRMVEFDRSIHDDVEVLSSLIEKMNDYIRSDEINAAQKLCDELSRSVKRISNQFENRRNYLTGLS